MTWRCSNVLALLLVGNLGCVIASHGTEDDLSKLDQVTPLVAWSMDSHSNTTLFHQYNNEERWNGDLTPLDSNFSQLFRPGAVNKSICIANKQFNIARHLTKEDCVRDPIKCSSGIIVTFWIRITSSGAGKIMDTSAGENSTGVMMQIGNDNDFVAMLTTSDKIYYEASIPLTKVLDSWSQIGLAWNKEGNQLDLYCNGTKLAEDQYKQTPRSKEVDIMDDTLSGPKLTNFTIGDSAHSEFCMDEVRIYDESLHHITTSDLHIYSFPTTSAPGNTLNRAQIIILTTLLPMLFMLLIFLVICAFLRHKRRNVSLRNYLSQTAVIFAPNDDDDLGNETQNEDEDTDVDTDHEIEKLNNRLLDDYGGVEV